MARKSTNNPQASANTQNSEAEETLTHKILIDDKAPKLSPKNPGFVYFELGKHLETGELLIRIKRNDGGGLHSKEWLKFSSVIKLLEQQESKKPFKSGVFKALFKGGSVNNVSFLAAVLRSSAMALIAPTEKSIFLHQLADDFANKKTKLMKLNPSK